MYHRIAKENAACAYGVLFRKIRHEYYSLSQYHYIFFKNPYLVRVLTIENFSVRVLTIECPTFSYTFRVMALLPNAYLLYYSEKF